MSKPGINVYPSLEELSRAAAERFVQTANARITDSGSFFAALSGGSTPRRLYELLATNEFSNRVAWERVHLFQVDERCVPPDHVESNFKMIREALLAPAGVPRQNFHRIAGEHADKAEAARQSAEELAHVIPAREGAFPRFDLIFLGMGSDGHTASLFPGSAALNETESWVCPSSPGPGGLRRITLTLPVLNAAAEIALLVAGPGKAVTLQKVLEGPYEPSSLPVQQVRPVNGQLKWYVDEAAASRIQAAARRGE